MRIFCICLVRNEADIIEQTLTAAMPWADSIIVYDNGSTDGTWEKVLKLSELERTVIPYKSDPKTYSNALRREPFADFRHQCNDGDWWCFLDSDEIYAENPRNFLSKVQEFYQIVWSASIQYRFTDEDVRQFENNPMKYTDDVPVTEKLRYYKVDWSEARFFRYDRNLKWPQRRAFPLSGAVCPRRILVKHYKYRSPEQIQRRLNVRKTAIEGAPTAFRHERGRDDWRSLIMPAADMDYDHHDGRFVVRDELMPRLPLTARLPPRLVNFCRRWKLLLG